jgi:hypothetical protein
VSSEQKRKGRISGGRYRAPAGWKVDEPKEICTKTYQLYRAFPEAAYEDFKHLRQQSLKLLQVSEGRRASWPYQIVAKAAAPIVGLECYTCSTLQN